MNNIDMNIFNNYATVETALLNDLATEVRTKGKKTRALKGECYYVKYDGVQYDITPEQCRIYKLIRNNFNMFVEQLNSAKSDMLGFWQMVWGERLPVIIADLEKGIEICEKYFEAFKSFITEGDEEVEETVESNDEVTVEKYDESSTEEPETTSENEPTTEEYEDVIVVEQGVCAPFIKADKSSMAPHDGSSCTSKNTL